MFTEDEEEVIKRFLREYNKGTLIIESRDLWRLIMDLQSPFVGWDTRRPWTKEEVE